MNTWPRFIFNTLSLSIAMAGSASAALQSFDPGPYTLATGRFPMWYQDFSNVKLELCLAKSVSSRAPGTPAAPGYMCTIPPEGTFNPAEPIIFPNNWPGEAFWFTADGSVGDRTFGIEQYVAALEAVAGEGVSVTRVLADPAGSEHVAVEPIWALPAAPASAATPAPEGPR